ncbi:basic phospholipase A2 myotoxin-I-like [Branchiostoma floridae x Branchiostoma japonicum]
MPRSVTQLGVMITKVTGRPPWKYWNYGCWCGKGGQGPASIDGKTVTCGDQKGTCKRTLCECDKALVNCFTRSPYVEKHDHMDQTICKKGNSTEVMDAGLPWSFP